MTRQTIIDQMRAALQNVCSQFAEQGIDQDNVRIRFFKKEFSGIDLMAMKNTTDVALITVAKALNLNAAMAYAVGMQLSVIFSDFIARNYKVETSKEIVAIAQAMDLRLCYRAKKKVGENGEVEKDADGNELHELDGDGNKIYDIAFFLFEIELNKESPKYGTSVYRRHVPMEEILEKYN